MNRSFIIRVIPILCAAAGLQAQTIGVDKPTLTFSAQVNGAPVSQTLNVTSSTGTVQFTTFPGTSWLRVLPVTGTAPSALTVTADPTGLQPATYQGTLSIFGPSNTATVNVMLTVGALSVTPTTLAFTYQAGGAVPAGQNIALASAQTTAVSLTATTASGGNWLGVSPATGNSPGTATVSLNSALLPSLATGTYNGTITVTPATGAASTVAVTLTITGPPPVTVSPTAMLLGFQIGGTNNSPLQILTLATTGSQGVAYALSSTVNPNPSGRVWFNLSTTGGTIPANGNTQINVTYDTTASLPAGNYTGSITVTTPGGTPTQQTVPITLVVSNSPLMFVSAGALTFNHQIGTVAPASQNITVSATSGALPLTIAATTASGGNWLSAPSSGVSGTAFSVSVNPAGLSVGTYQGTITVAGAGAANGPLQIGITLVVANNPVIVTKVNGCDSAINQTCPLTFSAQTGQAGPPAQSLRITSSTGAPLTFTATPVFGATNNCGGAWLLPGGALSTSGTTDATIQVVAQMGSIAAGSKCEATIAIAATNAAGTAVPNSPFNVAVTMYVSSTPQLVSNQNALNFAGPVGGPSPSAQTIALTSTSSEQVNWTLGTSANTPWLFVNLLNGSTAPNANNVIVQVNPLLLSAGLYTGSITITASGPGGAPVANSPITIPVTYQVTSGTLTVPTTTLTFSQPAGGAAPAAQTVAVTSSGQALAYTVSAQGTSGSVTWLTATPASGTTPGSILIAANAGSLPAGIYNGSVTVTATTPSTGGSPATIPVTLTVLAGTIAATPTTLTFAQAAGGAQPASQTITLTGTPGPIPITIATSTDNGGSAWLSATPATGNAPGTVTVTASAGSLPMGQYTGKVTITANPPGASGSPITIPVTLNVVSGQTLSVTPSTLNFTYVLGASNPAAQTVQLTASGTSAAAFTAAATTTGGGNWLSVTPASGNTGGSPNTATLTVSVNPASLTASNYNGTITVTSPSSVTPVTVNVLLTVSAVPKPVVTAIGNAGSYATGAVSPGENIVIFGTGIGPATLVSGTVTSGGTVATTAGNTQVTFDGTPAPVIYASGTQTSVMVPYGVFGRPVTTIRVTVQGVQSDPLIYNVSVASPGIYTLNQSGSGPGAILNQDFSVNGPNRPAAKGSVVAVYMTGEGASDIIPADGAFAPLNGTGLYKPRLPVSATVGGIPATVQYAGSSPGIVYGVMQVNLTIPDNVPSGPQTIVISFASAGQSLSTQAGVTVSVQ